MLYFAGIAAVIGAVAASFNVIFGWHNPTNSELMAAIALVLMVVVAIHIRNEEISK